MPKSFPFNSITFYKFDNQGYCNIMSVLPDIMSVSLAYKRTRLKKNTGQQIGVYLSTVVNLE